MNDNSERLACTDVYKEGPCDFESMQAHPVALDHVLDIVNRAKKGDGLWASQCKWFDDACPSNRIPLIYNPSQASADHNSIYKATQTRHMLQSSADLLSNILRIVAHHLEICDENTRAFKMRAGFFAVPDEILSLILEYASLVTLRGEKRRVGADDSLDSGRSFVFGVKSGMKLSHVCKRFRRLAIYSPNLWSRIHNIMPNSELISMCLSRCRHNNAAVTLSTHVLNRTNDMKQKNILFIRTVLEHSQKCGVFALKGNFGRSVSAGWINEYVQDFTALAEQVDFSNLLDLIIRYPHTALTSSVRGDRQILNALHFYRAWSTPKLQSLYAENSVPVPFSGSLSLASLTIFLEPKPEDVSISAARHDDDFDWDAGALVSFLVECPNLTNFRFALASASGAKKPSASQNVVALPLVHFLDISLVRCSSESLEPFFNIVRFPSATNMKLHIFSSNENARRRDMLFEEVFSAVVPDAEASLS